MSLHEKMERLHAESLGVIVDNLSSFGVYDPEYVFVEPLIYPVGKPWFFEPDVFVKERNGSLHIIEYKNSERARSKAVIQLAHAGFCTMKMLGVYPRLHFVWDPQELYHSLISRAERTTTIKNKPPKRRRRR